MSHKGPYVWERVLVHLNRNWTKDLSLMDAHPYALTHLGVAEACGISRPHASIVIKQLINDGLISQYHAHVHGAKSVLKVTRPTTEGVLKAKSIEQIYQRQGVEVLAPVQGKVARRDTMTERCDALEKRIVMLEDAARRARILPGKVSITEEIEEEAGA